MSRFGLDYAWAKLSPGEHKAIGSSFACRYLSNDASKNLSPAEAKELRSGGIDVVVVWESTATRALGGQAAGEADARAALGEAQACGIPEGRPIYFAIDFDASVPQQAAINAYFRGVAAVLGLHRTGAYGGYWPIKRLFDAGLITYGWQTYAWSGRNIDKRAQLYQYKNGYNLGGVSVDFNRALKPDFGQWGFKPAKPKPQGPAGVFRFEGTFDTKTGQWTVKGAHGHGVVFGPEHKRASVELQVDVADGSWRCKPLVWNSPPLG